MKILFCLNLVLLTIASVGPPLAAQDTEDEIQQMMSDGANLAAAEKYSQAIEIFRQITARQPGNGRAWHLLGYSLHMNKQLDEAIEIHIKAAEFKQFRPISLYNLACAWSLKGEVDQAVANLESAFDAGFDQFEFLENDSDLDRVRDDPRFVELVKRARETAPKGRLNVAILVHQGVELLDFAGPAEVFATTRVNGSEVFRVFTVGPSREPVTSQGFLTFTPQYSLSDCPQPDIVVLPGGQTRVALDNDAVIEWIKSSAEKAEIVMSVCTGAFLLARAQLLDGKQATTHWNAIENLRRAAPKTTVVDDRRVVDNGKVIVAAGVSAGIDAALYVVQRLHGTETARATAHHIEYDWKPQPEKPASIE